jgi:hypothetical protein
MIVFTIHVKMVTVPAATDEILEHYSPCIHKCIIISEVRHDKFGIIEIVRSCYYTQSSRLVVCYIYFHGIFAPVTCHRMNPTDLIPAPHTNSDENGRQNHAVSYYDLFAGVGCTVAALLFRGPALRPSVGEM